MPTTRATTVYITIIRAESMISEKARTPVGALVEQPEFYSYLTGYEIMEFTSKIKGNTFDSVCNDFAARKQYKYNK